MRILFVEDDEKIARFVSKGLEEEGFEVVHVADGDDGYDLARTQSFAALVLDIMVPGRDGLSILGRLRKKGDNVPVVLVTARTELDERVEGLELGADDYISKPFYVEELVARLRSVLRRSKGEGHSVLQVGDLTVDVMTREVSRSGESIELTAREYSLLNFLMRSPGHVRTRTQILEHVWGYDFDPGSNLVDVYIQRVRKKIDTGGGPSLIETVRGVGYKMRTGEG
jgi:DNA-binding response OmpR family regulator